MEIKSSKPKTSKIFSFLPKSATVSFQPYSPGRTATGGGADHHHHHHHKLKGCSGPMIPDEARRKPKNGGENTFGTQEPTSPKISCMGQIKHKKKKVCESKNGFSKKDEINKPESSSKPRNKLLKPSLSFGNLFRGKQRKRRSAQDVFDKNPDPVPAPSLDQMKRFTSGRSSFENFDWKAVHDQRVSDDTSRDCYSDHDGSDEDYEHEESIIPHSAPMMMGGGIGIPLEPRKEINLWKRRTMAPPRPLQIKT